MNKQKLRKKISTMYKYEVLVIERKSDYMISFKTLGYIKIPSKNKKYAKRYAREKFGCQIANVKLISKIVTEKVMSQCRPEVLDLIDKYGDLCETEVLL